MERNLGLLLIILTLFVNYSVALSWENSLKCNPNVDTPGTTLPRGDIFIEAGLELEIFCIINQTHPLALNRNSSHLLFYNATRPVASKYVEILNETAILLKIPNVQKSKSMFYCKLKNPTSESAVCLNTVIIDTKPREISNFSCVSHNWLNLICTWKNPHHYVKTKYELKFKPAIRQKKTVSYSCPINNTSDESCIWDLSTDPIYRQQYKEYYFIIQGSNQFGTGPKKEIHFLHYQHVIPSAPKLLEAYNSTTHSVSIRWQPVFPMDGFPAGLVHKVEYISTWDKEWKQVDTSKINPINNPMPSLTIDNLEYANTHYDIRVYMKSKTASDEFWSTFNNTTFRTLSIEPKNPPKTDIGSFQLENSIAGKRNVYIYWQQLAERYYNGGNFTYLITQVLPPIGQEVELKPHEQTNTYAKINNLDNDKQYKFRIYSINDKGKSSPSEIIIPSKNDLLAEPISFTKIAYEKQTYELSWVPPKFDDPDVVPVNYTLFWCEDKRDRPYQCAGFLNWTHIPSDSITKNITVPEDKIYQFAISVNSARSSSGMVWSMCTVIHNKFSSRMNNVYIRVVGSSSIVVAWQLECSDRVGVIRGFIVYYCPAWMSSVNTACKDQEKNVTIHDASVTELNVTHLSSYSTYKLRVAVLTTDGPGEPSDPVFNTTLASAPSKPPYIRDVVKITNTTANVIWVKPSEKERNGNIVEYDFYLNKTKWTKEIEKPGNEQTGYLTGLDAYTTYSLTMRALTNAWSELSPEYIFTTSIGRPEELSITNIEYENNSCSKIFWEPPKKPGGPIQGYEIIIVYFNKKIQRVNATCGNQNVNCSVLVKHEDLQCDINHRPSAQVRAYNLINSSGENIFLHGKWSKKVDLTCVVFQPIWQVVFVIVLFVCFIPLIYFLGKKIFGMFEFESKRDVDLPEGLKGSDSKKKPQARITSDEIKSPKPADQEFLIYPTRTPNRSESENDSEQLSLGSGDTQSSECHQSSTSTGSEIEPISNASTPPMQPYQSHNLKLSMDKSAANLLDKINQGSKPVKCEVKPSESNLSYVIIGNDNTIIQNNPQHHMINAKNEEEDYNSLEINDCSLPPELLCSLTNEGLPGSEFLPELQYSEPPSGYQKFGELCRPILQTPPILQHSDHNKMSSIKNVVISTKPNTPSQTVTTTTTISAGYQSLPQLSISQIAEPKPCSPSLPVPPVPSIVINKGSNGYVTVSTASIIPSHSVNCV